MLLVVSTEDEDNIVLEETRGALGPCNVQTHFFVGQPLVFIDIVYLARLQLNFFDVLIATKGINFVSTATNGREEGFLLQHWCSVEDVLVDILEAVITHSTNQEPTTDVFILLEGKWTLTLSPAVNINAGEMARELTLILGNKPPLWKLLRLCTLDK